MARHQPGTAIADCPELKGADGRSLQCVSFTPPPGTQPGKASWEMVVYAEEAEYFLLFTVSAHDPGALSGARPLFESMIAAYK